MISWGAQRSTGRRSKIKKPRPAASRCRAPAIKARQASIWKCWGSSTRVGTGARRCSPTTASSSAKQCSGRLTLKSSSLRSGPCQARGAGTASCKMPVSISLASAGMRLLLPARTGSSASGFQRVRALRGVPGRGRSVEAEPLGAHERAPVRSLRRSILAHLVLRPAIEFRRAKTFHAALLLDGLAQITPTIVILDGILDARLIETVAVDRGRQRQAHGDAGRPARPAEPEARHREDMVGQADEVGDLARMIANGTDGSAAEPHRFGGDHERRKGDAGVDGRVEEGIQMIVGEGFAAPGMELALPAVVAAENEERRGAANPGLRKVSAGEQAVDRTADLGIL